MDNILLKLNIRLASVQRKQQENYLHVS